MIDWIVRNPTDGTLRRGSVNGAKYTSFGASVYPLSKGTVYNYPYRVMLQGKINWTS
jgi:hypothetical protein